jgi:DNA-binding NtrC family response regulator
VRLPLEFYGADPGRRLAVGTSVNLSPTGVLAELDGADGLVPGQLVRVHLGLSAEVWADEPGVFEGQLHRLENGTPARCAVEVMGQPPGFLLAPELIGRHPAMVATKRRLLDVAAHDVNVLVRGESGTGKNVVAALIHRYSRRAGRPLMRVHCPAIPDTLMESVLFGHEKWAFTDARSSRPGLFRMADRGTLVLDEISAIPAFKQAKLLEAVEEKRFIPIGSGEAVEVDVRLIATTNDAIEDRLEDGSFRRDLFYRMAEVELTIPPLRERKSDIPLLADYFARRYCGEFGKSYAPLERDLLRTLRDYPWPGNVRELENVVKRIVIMGECKLPGASGAAQDAEPIRVPAEQQSMNEAREEAEKRALFATLESVGRNRTLAAAKLGVSYRTLLRKMRKYALDL